MNIETPEADEKAILELFDFLRYGQYLEGGYAPVNVQKSLESIYQAVKEGGVFNARSDGKLVGSLAMVKFDYWYSDWFFLSNRWFFVPKSQRFRDVGVKLMRAARLHAARAAQVDGTVGVTAFITVDSPDRRPKGTAMSLYAQIAGFTPLGHVIKLR